MRYLIADISKINKSIRTKTFDQKVIDIILDKQCTESEKAFRLQQMLKARQMKLDKQKKTGSI